MTRLFCLFLLYLPLSASALSAGDDPIAATAEMIKKVDIHAFAKTFASTIDITILNEENIYSAAQAEIVIENFFKNNPVKSVTILHRVNSNPNLRFAVLTVLTNNGSYRTSVSLKQVDGRFLVNELRIETEKKE